jgi:hypothetical protein
VVLETATLSEAELAEPAALLILAKKYRAFPMPDDEDV